MVAYIILPLYFNRECIMQPRPKFKLNELLVNPKLPFIPLEIKQYEYEPVDRKVGDKLSSTDKPRSKTNPRKAVPPNS